jgi:uncharacterized membrane protein YwzB
MPIIFANPDTYNSVQVFQHVGTIESIFFHLQNIRLASFHKNGPSQDLLAKL